MVLQLWARDVRRAAVVIKNRYLASAVPSKGSASKRSASRRHDDNVVPNGNATTGFGTAVEE